MLQRVVHEEDGPVLQSTVSDALKVQGSLNGGISHHAGSPSEVLAIEVESLDEEIGLVETRHGKPSGIALHVLMEILAVHLAESVRTAGKGIHVIG